MCYDSIISTELIWACEELKLALPTAGEGEGGIGSQLFVSV